MDRESRSYRFRACASSVLAAALAMVFWLAWFVHGWSEGVRRLVAFAVSILFVLAVQEAAHCWRCARSGGDRLRGAEPKTFPHPDRKHEGFQPRKL